MTSFEEICATSRPYVYRWCGANRRPPASRPSGPPAQELNRVELPLQALLRFQFSFYLSFGNGDIDHKAESVRDLSSR